ncbi:amino acid ABC transporter permease, partial [Elioraea sp.]|uniref:amino acid ABC transporter permease n=1 Tax=Elioraea sp. TaxID=2185103 RepID=UPI0025B8CD76
EPAAARRARWRRAAIDVLQFVLFLGLMLWLLVEAAERMGYNWQWHLVPRYVVQVFDGEVFLGPLLRGLLVTLEMSAIALVLTVVIGLGAALLRLSGSAAGRWLVVGYVEVIRNTPLLVQLYLVYFILAPIIGLDRFWAGVLCLALFEGAFAAEIFRGGILAVRKGQWEAAWTLGLSRRDAYRRIVLPQALRVILPPLAGLGVSLVKHSAIVSVIAVFDLTNEGRNVISDTFMTFEIWLTVAALYLVVTVSLSLAVGLLEKRLKGAMA